MSVGYLNDIEDAADALESYGITHEQVLTVFKGRFIMKSVMSFPERGNYGKSNWRGNTSGYVIKELIQHFDPKIFVDACKECDLLNSEKLFFC